MIFLAWGAGTKSYVWLANKVAYSVSVAFFQWAHFKASLTFEGSVSKYSNKNVFGLQISFLQWATIGWVFSVEPYDVEGNESGLTLVGAVYNGGLRGKKSVWGERSFEDRLLGTELRYDGVNVGTVCMVIWRV